MSRQTSGQTDEGSMTARDPPAAGLYSASCGPLLNSLELNHASLWHCSVVEKIICKEYRFYDFCIEVF